MAPEALRRAFHRATADAAGRVSLEHLSVVQEHKASRLPLGERLRHALHAEQQQQLLQRGASDQGQADSALAAAAVAAADRGHPQSYEPLPTAGQIRRRRRQMQEADTAAIPDDAEVMDDSTTDPMRIHVDWSQTRPETAYPHSVCFRLGDWFKWCVSLSSSALMRAAPPHAAAVPVKAARARNTLWLRAPFFNF
eukprot:SAG31_NODE_3150_length_4617_cov_23.083001_2_plen_195_part_00